MPILACWSWESHPKVLPQWPLAQWCTINAALSVLHSQLTLFYKLYSFASLLNTTVALENVSLHWFGPRYKSANQQIGQHNWLVTPTTYILYSTCMCCIMLLSVVTYCLPISRSQNCSTPIAKVTTMRFLGSSDWHKRWSGLQQKPNGLLWSKPILPRRQQLLQDVIVRDGEESELVDWIMDKWILHANCTGGCGLDAQIQFYCITSELILAIWLTSSARITLLWHNKQYCFISTHLTIHRAWFEVTIL